ncbi:MAG: hypothetical protein HC922_11440 [Leptolyngbyaceae cyanobacterium SM2_3_12]|nr:hypothetical protein [Leptolyngbyaceae cyanobacterium SM2_3_12]
MGRNLEAPSPGWFSPWEGVHPHPYAMAQAELADALDSFQTLIGDKSTVLLPAVLTAENEALAKAGPASRSRGRKSSRSASKAASRQSAALNGLPNPVWGQVVLPLPSQLAGAMLLPIHSASLGASDPASDLDSAVLHPWVIQGWWLTLKDFLAPAGGATPGSTDPA